jgi:hypothetical protein
MKRWIVLSLAAGLLVASTATAQQKDPRAIGPGVDRPANTDPPVRPGDGFLGRIVSTNVETGTLVLGDMPATQPSGKATGGDDGPRVSGQEVTTDRRARVYVDPTPPKARTPGVVGGRTFKVAADTTITLEGRKVRFGDLQVGQYARVLARSADPAERRDAGLPPAVMVAHRIEVFSKPPTAAPDADPPRAGSGGTDR